MYEYIRGRLASKNPTQAVLDVGGVGYRMAIPVSTFEQLGDTGQDAHLFAHLYVREDTLRVYGFATSGEREMFEMLIAVAGIGPNLALTILSGIPAGELVKAIAEQNTDLLQTIKGIGKKTAQRVVLELKERVSIGASGPAGAVGGLLGDGVAALESLGVPRPSAERAVAAALKAQGPSASVEDVVRAALQLL